MTAKQEAVYRFVLVACIGIGAGMATAGFIKAQANTERIVALETQQKASLELLREVRTDIKRLLERLK